jgi:hypothetical protein
MSNHEHTINRSGTTPNSDDDTDDADSDDERDEHRSEAEIKRELRKSEVGRAILGYNRARRDSERFSRRRR